MLQPFTRLSFLDGPGWDFPRGRIHKECIVSPSPSLPSILRGKCLVRIRAQQYPSEMPETPHTRCRSMRHASATVIRDKGPSYTPLRQLMSKLHSPPPEKERTTSKPKKRREDSENPTKGSVEYGNAKSWEERP